jgi:NitT/TauT family transport system substrate-binding protein
MITRRSFVNSMALAGAGAALGYGRGLLAAEPLPETNRIRLTQTGGICFAPIFVAEQLMRAEGFSDVQYVRSAGGAATTPMLTKGEVDITIRYVASNVLDVDAGAPTVMLAGVHPGCFELVGSQRVQTVRDLKDKTVAIPVEGSTQHVFLAAIAAHVGLHPKRDIKWVEIPLAEQLRQLGEGKVDAVITFPPVAQEARAKKIGKVIVNSAVDKPWSQYFCCAVTASRDFVRKHPVATKRAVRALLKATDLCATSPEPTARYLVDRGFTDNYEYALQAMKEIPYRSWREYSAEDSIRFWALRLHETGFVKTSPNKIISEGSDWRFLNELKKELKA